MALLVSLDLMDGLEPLVPLDLMDVMVAQDVMGALERLEQQVRSKCHFSIYLSTFK